MTGLVELKIKRLTIAAEARLIKAEEKRWLKRGRELRQGNRNFEPSYNQHDRLRSHRVLIVRRAARAMHLAHAYLTDQTYASVEDAASFARLEKQEYILIELTKQIAKETLRFVDEIKHAASADAIMAWMYGAATQRQQLKIVEDAMASEAAKAAVLKRLAQR